uniref:Uncharacterized protein n=1 Tax=Anguilla anguilla TaxID=7936 RepID=A0A0E9VJZ0_ANGAN
MAFENILRRPHKLLQGEAWFNCEQFRLVCCNCTQQANALKVTVCTFNALKVCMYVAAANLF